MKQVKVKILRNGQVIIGAEGFKGKSCEEATAFLEALFPNKEKDFKPEYYEEDTQTIARGLPSGYCG